MPADTSVLYCMNSENGTCFFGTDISHPGSHWLANIYSPEEGGGMFLRSFGNYLNVHAELLPRMPTVTWLVDHLNPLS
jgi:hypothetical protein